MSALARLPRMAVICAAVACLNALSWSLVSPPFEVPDEPDHFAYVKQLAETGQLPSSGSEQLSKEETTALSALHYESVRLRPQIRTIATPGEQEALESALASSARETGSPTAGVAASQPPLYYALEAIPYTIASSGSVLDRLFAMRLTSALFAGLTALFAFLFVREALPRAPWACSAGGLSIALAPLLGFMSGAVNPDAMLAAVSAALFYCLARAFRRGLATREAIAIGVVCAIGFLVKLNFIGLAPGVLVGLLVLTVRQMRAHRRSAYLPAAFAAAIALSPAIAYAAINAVSGDPLLGLVTQAAPIHSAFAELSYIWQLYLPALPGTRVDFPGLLTARQIWFDQYVGQYGWLDTPMPGWVDELALVPALAIAALCARSLHSGRRALRRRAGELATYAIMGIGLMALIGAASYQHFPGTDAEFGQVRYLLPLLALLGAVLTLAARGAGRRWGPAVGASIVVLFLAHDLFSQLQVVARYYA
jgi:4-amino-4-deoxy-L-arabinose transferase-like glycosyltransferase